ncbi:hypothetical protein [Pseudoalteromonas maricaloris]|uniref:Uncharacterized protein n=1 Tax=Pseudoalteromonas maricaloris TaxID=184924 RepID=A0A8I2H8J6_9GAMM|nr:hypothetical protein [Pseudoalteromonas maricaloris]NLR22989.1 hypothetical protein [Pseudoalteromonas maricaloris]WOX27894.1 hypothetical protein R5H13_14715 [Pseudoalteromonas maricaloris]
MTQIILNSQCFEAGEELRINIQLKDTTPSSQRSSNINIDIIYIGEHRDIPRLMFSHTVDPQEPTLIIPRVITDDFETGLYQVRNLRFVHENGEKPVHIKSDGEDLLYFWVAPKQSYKLGKEQIIEKIKEVKVKQKQYAERSIYSKRCDEASHSSKFRVLIFGVGCLLHSLQQMKGYRIIPLGRGFSYGHMLEAVNLYAKQNLGTELPFESDIESRFSQSTPVFVIDFWDIWAPNTDDCISTAVGIAEDIFTVLAFGRGQRPSYFAYVVLNKETGSGVQSFNFPGYKGNLAPSFNPLEGAELIEKIFPLIQKDPWVDLIMRLYADALNEPNLSYRFFKYWSLLELIAKKRIQTPSNKPLLHPDGESILYNNDEPVNPNGTLGKVYRFCLQAKLQPRTPLRDGQYIHFESYSNSSKGLDMGENTIIFRLWDSLRGLYEIRNSTAHAGEFNPDEARKGNDRAKLAAQLWELKYGTFMFYVSDFMKEVIEYELSQV